MDVAAYLVDCGVPVRNYHVESAILSTEYQFLSLFLDNGYNINEPITWNTPSLLMLVHSLYFFIPVFFTIEANS